ncbi:MAG: MFS transporter, partial [Rhodobacter sp.]|nr:MFS transporter [Rhodobacter sp.]
YTFCYVGILTVLPPFLPESGRIVILGAMPLVSILSSMTLGILLLRLIEAVSVTITGFAVCAAAALSIAAFPGSTLPVLALGVGFGLVQGATFASVPQLNETSVDRALANGGLAQVGNLGNTVGTPVMLATIGPFGYGGLMLSLFLVFCAGAAIHLALRAVRRIS